MVRRLRKECGRRGLAAQKVEQQHRRLPDRLRARGQRRRGRQHQLCLDRIVHIVLHEPLDASAGRCAGGQAERPAVSELERRDHAASQRDLEPCGDLAQLLEPRIVKLAGQIQKYGQNAELSRHRRDPRRRDLVAEFFRQDDLAVVRLGIDQERCHLRESLSPLFMDRFALRSGHGVDAEQRTFDF